MSYAKKEDRVKYEKERFKREFPAKTLRGKIANFFLVSTKDWDLERQIKLPNYFSIKIPYDTALNKNNWILGRKRMFLSKETKAAETALYYKILSKKPKFKTGKIWIDLLVEKPWLMGDPINFVDRICDVVKKAIKVDDRWFSIRRVDWRINKNNPAIILGIGQETINDEERVCPVCGRILPTDPYFSMKKSNRFYLSCRSCRSRKLKEFTT